MELSESVQKGLQSLADPSLFDLKSFAVLIDVAFRSLLSAHPGPSLLDQPELKSIDQILLKQCHAAATTYILEGVKQNADKSIISSCLEDVTFNVERIEIFYNSYQKYKEELEGFLASIGRSPPHINDVSWRLEYHMKNGHVHKVNEPCYLLSLNVENGGMGGSSEDINFSCTVEQLQDLVGKMKDAAKSLEKATQM
ncbi:COMM domain-containing protein 3 [Polymixia lowei]